ncbi:UDP-glucose dehydrogenase family protein [Pseudomonas oryzihabitans]|uniref:UDP-glucose dehydrogenase family protein n=1 Tax=Pseudomonas oryzihabitans TaxID=47885 RepID=UPI00363D14B4
MKISVIGAGYVGLVSAACFAEMGNYVVCIDSSVDKVNDLNNGVIPIFEPGLESLVSTNVKAKRLVFTCDYSHSSACDIHFIAVGTPQSLTGEADLSYVFEAANSLSKYISSGSVVVTKSTVPVGTSKKIKEIFIKSLEAQKKSIDFYVASNPEFLKEGAAIEDFMRPDRIILGCDDRYSENKLLKLYSIFNRNHKKTIVMDVPSAELTKYAANAMLATRISFMNELSNLADLVGADVDRVREGIGSDSRIGYDFLYAGCGYGGSCFPKDVEALKHTGTSVTLKMDIISAVQAVNERQKKVLANKIFAEFGVDLEGYKVAIWGLAFKPNTDDMRDAPSLVVIDSLLEAGAKVVAYDPVASGASMKTYMDNPCFSIATDQYECLNGADFLVIVTEWKVFRVPDFGLIKSKLKNPVIFDGRNIYSCDEMREMGFAYHCIGRR